MTRSFLVFILFLLGMTGCGSYPYPSGPGTLFVRQQICDLGDFKERFFTPKNDLKHQGFHSYRFYRDWNDPKTYLLVFESDNLRKSAAFLESSNFFVACVGAGLGVPLVWAGQGEGDLPEGDLLLARYELANVDFWKSTQEEAVKDHQERLYWLSSVPQLVLVARTAIQPAQERSLLLSSSAQQARRAQGVLREDFWLGSFLEKGVF